MVLASLVISTLPTAVMEVSYDRRIRVLNDNLLILKEKMEGLNKVFKFHRVGTNRGSRLKRAMFFHEFNKINRQAFFLRQKLKELHTGVEVSDATVSFHEKSRILETKILKTFLALMISCNVAVAEFNIRMCEWDMRKEMYYQSAKKMAHPELSDEALKRLEEVREMYLDLAVLSGSRGELNDVLILYHPKIFRFRNTEENKEKTWKKVVQKMKSFVKCLL